MNASDGIAPAVASILETAKGQDVAETEQLSVSARSVDAAIDQAEAEGRVPIIAEVKPTSPTSDTVRNDDPVDLAGDMVAGGATAISVLTESAHFGGSLESLERVRAAVDVPVLRKDFILAEPQLDQVEADIVLLIARFVDDLPAVYQAAIDRGFQVLVEVHSADELDKALEAGATLVGINNRDLAALEVDLGTFEQLAPLVPEDVTIVAESGIATVDDVHRMRAAGADALLVGSSIMAGRITTQTATLVGAEQ